MGGRSVAEHRLVPYIITSIVELGREGQFEIGWVIKRFKT